MDIVLGVFSGCLDLFRGWINRLAGLVVIMELPRVGYELKPGEDGDQLILQALIRLIKRSGQIYQIVEHGDVHWVMVRIISYSTEIRTDI